MGDPKNSNLISFSLPPGCRFYPSDEQILRDYLTIKNSGDQGLGFDVIKEIDLYVYNPFDLPEATCFRFGRGGRKRHWYCYAARVLKERGSRRAGDGYWKRRGRVRDVVGSGGGKVVLGTRKSFVFHIGDSPKNASRRTNWVMYEYALIDHDMAPFVLCRVFAESRHGNNISEHVLSSCGEESVGTVRHIGVQYDGTITSVIGDAKEHDNNSVDHRNEVSTFPVGPVSEMDDRVTRGPVVEQTRSSGCITGGTMIVSALITQQLMAILEGDFIELDDLLSPLPGVD